MYVLQTTWHINGKIQKSQNTYENYDDLLARVKYLEPLLLGNDNMKLINVEIFYFTKKAFLDPCF